MIPKKKTWGSKKIQKDVKPKRLGASKSTSENPNSAQYIVG